MRSHTRFDVAVGYTFLCSSIYSFTARSSGNGERNAVKFAARPRCRFIDGSASRNGVCFNRESSEARDGEIYCSESLRSCPYRRD